MKGFLNRFVIFCPRVNCLVNQEVSYRVMDEGEIEFSATCTGIRDSCKECVIVKIIENERVTTRK